MSGLGNANIIGNHYIDIKFNFGQFSLIVIFFSTIFFNGGVPYLLDLKIYVDTSPDTRIVRRIKRDINERNRKLYDILNRIEKFVIPSTEKFIKPLKKYANIIIPCGVENFSSIDLLAKIFYS